MPYRRLWTSGIIGLAVVLVATSNEAQSKTIRVTADITQTLTLGAQDVLGDSNIANADLSDHSGHQVGTLTAHCTIISIFLVIRSSSASSQPCFPISSSSLGGPLAVPRASAEFSIVGGQTDFAGSTV